MYFVAPPSWRRSERSVRILTLLLFFLAQRRGDTEKRASFFQAVYSPDYAVFHERRSSPGIVACGSHFQLANCSRRAILRVSEGEAFGWLAW